MTATLNTSEVTTAPAGPPRSFLLSLAAVLGVGPFAIDMYLASLPEIGADFAAPSWTVQLTLTGYLIMLGAGQLVAQAQVSARLALHGQIGHRHRPRAVALGVADILESAIFYASDDSDADSYDTQLERFQADAAERIIGLLEGDDAALENRIRDKLAGHYFLVPEDRTVTVVIDRDRLDVTITARAVPAAPEAAAEGA